MRNLVSDLPVQPRRRANGNRPAHPLLAALPAFGLALVVPAVGLAFSIGWPWVVAVACSLVFVAVLQAARAALVLGRRRRTADEWLLWGATARPSSALLSWRAAELTSPRLRSTLAHSLARIQREARGETLPGAVPLNTGALRRHVHLVGDLEQRLEDRTLPVSARGMVLVDRLLTEPGSPLYSSPVPDDVLAEAVLEALWALDSVPLATAA